MKRLTATVLVAALTASFAPLPAMAKGPQGCPPGLAKKSPACVPPGQAKKGVSAEEWANRDRDDDYDRDRYDRDDGYIWRRGDRISDDRYRVLRRGDRVVMDGREYIVVERDGQLVLRRGDDFYRLPQRESDRDYVRIGDQILSVSRETKQVIEVIRLADLILR